MTTNCTPTDNRLLAALPRSVLHAWLPKLDRVELPLGQVVDEGGSPPRHVYFPTTAIVSPLQVLHNGDTAAMAMIGREGMLGVSIFLGERSLTGRSVVQIAGQGFRLPAAVVRRDFDRCVGLRQLLLRYTQTLIVQFSQTAVCNRHHSVRQQLCRWLLLGLDRLPGRELAMTHEAIAGLIGVRREGVTEAAIKLQAAGVIRYARGHITVVDKAGLERGSCECYEVVAEEYTRLLPLVEHANTLHCRRTCAHLAATPQQAHRPSDRAWAEPARAA